MALLLKTGINVLHIMIQLASLITFIPHHNIHGSICKKSVRFLLILMPVFVIIGNLTAYTEVMFKTFWKNMCYTLLPNLGVY